MSRQEKRSNISIMARLIGLVKPLTGYMLIAILMGVIGNLCAAFITIFGAFAILNVLGFSVSVSKTAAFAAVLIFALVRGILRYAEQSCNHFIAFKLLAIIRDRVFAALRRLCPAKLEGKDKGNLISVITSDIELLEVFYAHTISPIVIAFIFSVIMCIFIGSYSLCFGLIAALSYITVGVIIPIFISKLSGDYGIRFRRRSGELSSFVLDSLRGLPEIIRYRMGEKRLSAMEAITNELSEDESRMKSIAGRNGAITNTVILIFDIIMLFAAAISYKNGNVEFDGVLVPVVALMSSFGPVVALANLGSTLQNTFAAGGRVLDILEETPIVEEISGRPEIDFQGVRAENVTFSYVCNENDGMINEKMANDKLKNESKEKSDDTQDILTDVSIDIKKGSVVGIIGKSGSGKSTLLKLFMRFWDTDKGDILISDVGIKEINTSNLRHMESFVTQDTHLFHDSIEANIRIARLDATHEEIVSACKKASIHEFIMSLPKGYDTPVGELGDTLSGGERQRIGLARAFLHDAPFILLDEPTSNLDSLNEAVILKALDEEGRGKTIALVSHRASTMTIADKVYSVEELSGKKRVS